MTEDRNPKLQALFARADQELDDQTFPVEIMDRIEGLVRRRQLLLILSGIAGLAVLWLLAPALQHTALLLVSRFSTSLISLDSSAASQFLLPVNNVACLTVLGLMLVRMMSRKLFHRP